MRKITEWSFRNKAALSLMIVMALAMGMMSYLRMPMEFMPPADNPQVMITTIGPGSSAKMMEQQVTQRVEQAVMYMPGKTSMLSASGDGYSQVTVNFGSGTNMKEATHEIEQSISGIVLPQQVMEPFVLQLNTTMIPISWITLAFDSDLNEGERSSWTERVVDELKKVDGAGEIQVTGAVKPIVSIIPDTSMLAEKGVPLQLLLGVLQGRGVSASLGERDINGQTVHFKLTDQLSSLETIQNLPLAMGVKLSDVAAVEWSNGQEGISRMNGKDAVLLTVAKTAEANAVAVGDQIEKVVRQLQSERSDVDVVELISTAESITGSVNSMLREVLLGALFATVVILVFMRNLKATFITILSIPLSLGITLYLLQLSGISLNVITLGGVAVAVGRLVDDSIVVIENIYRRLQREAFSIRLVTDATKEVASAITSSTIVTVAVFLPMGLLRGSLQNFLLPFALTVSYSLLASLIVALTVVPVLSAWLLKGTKEREHAGPAVFASFVRWNLERKWLPLTLSIVLLAASVGAYIAMPKGAMDASSAHHVNVTLQYPSDMPLERVREGGEDLERYMLGDDRVEWALLTMGNSSDMARYGSVTSPTLVTILVDLKEDVDAETFMRDLKANREEYDRAELQASAIDIMMGGSGTSVMVDVTGDDPALLANTASTLTVQIGKLNAIRTVESNQQSMKPVYAFKLNPEKTRGDEAVMQLNSLLNPIPIGSVTLDGADVPVIIQPSANPISEQELKGLSIMTAEGPTTLSRLGEFVRTEEPSLFYHKEGKPYIRITATADPEQLSVAGEEIGKLVDELTLPEGVHVIVGGASAELSEDFADLGLTALISIALVYLIMVLTFKTLRAPLAIMVTLPLAAIGAVTGLLATGVTPDFTAMFGALMLIGIVVTNAIVLIDRVKQNEEYMPIREALVEAATTRMRPIMMTALATICAMLPLVFGEHASTNIVSQSLAIVVIGGLAVATLLTLVIVPCTYELLFFCKARRQRRTAG
ncbi:efflux RND transporter permease subunit [Paenibacillus chungangensis]|uniref:Efflux RND transporter permease subunit n=1 Tax=Paenibacillus chungangensis TaxID=696535 RepID=A0ABW3HP74_9BACL